MVLPTNGIEEKHDLMYRALASFPQAVCILDQERRMVFSNRKYEEFIEEIKKVTNEEAEKAIFHSFQQELNECFDQILMGEKESFKRFVLQEQPWTVQAQELPVKGEEVTYVMHTLRPEDPIPDEHQHRKDFIQIAAHELRTPLTAIKGFIQLVLERYKERNRKWFFQPTSFIMSEIERDKTFFKVIYDEAIRLDQLTNELVSIFKIDQGKFQMNFQKANFTQVIQEAIEEFMIPTDFHHLHFFSLEEDLPVYIDIKQVKRVISNLLSNAIKYSPDAPDVFIQLRSEDGYMTLSVRDEGIGIPNDQQKRIFERFFRVYSPEHEHIHGYGIGLHICKEIIHKHNGALTFESTFGKGSTFFVRLPLSYSKENE
ncbi:sensor histidine kinase [Caldalkalibacillus salinus]|uniref:sensor histidine kinase n=1 Tax=Caldalkalibacillus salinus TaxID=2803787 RepID=UPI0019210281|nr:HAMP domain-containing sensor histidine kinase [Caldalkalibacillus salinus]